MSGPPVPLLLLFADTGGGHRAAAQAVTEALHRHYPDRFAPVLCDPLGGPRSAWLLRRITNLYGPSIRFAPWSWGAVYYASDSRPAMRLVRSTLLTLANRPVADAVAAQRPAAIVSFHPLTGRAAVNACDRKVPVITVVTDLVYPHTSWQDDEVDQIVVPPTTVRRPDRCVEIGLPVSTAFTSGPLRPDERAALRRSLGLDEHRFLVLLSGGGEGAGGIARRAAAILDRFDDVDVVALCGRNERLRRRMATRTDRLTVNGFVDNVADWLRCADIVVGKAGPGTIAEATCCGVPLLLTSHVPGQERGNTEFVVAAGAGRHAPTIRKLLRDIDELRRHPSTLDTMQAASAQLGQPHAAADIAQLIAATVHTGQHLVSATGGGIG